MAYYYTNKNHQKYLQLGDKPLVDRINQRKYNWFHHKPRSLVDAISSEFFGLLVAIIPIAIIILTIAVCVNGGPLDF